MTEVFGFQAPTSTYHSHRGHAWAVVEKNGQVRIGLDDFSQKILGPADEVALPEADQKWGGRGWKRGPALGGSS
jgi:glycine cleavage system H lipoate-binding protein